MFIRDFEVIFSYTLDSNSVFTHGRSTEESILHLEANCFISSKHNNTFDLSLSRFCNPSALPVPRQMLKLGKRQFLSKTSEDICSNKSSEQSGNACSKNSVVLLIAVDLRSSALWPRRTRKNRGCGKVSMSRVMRSASTVPKQQRKDMKKN